MEPDRLKQALERLYARKTFGIKLGLDVERAILERIGNPEKSFKAIHVAGTNGKGSVCVILASILRNAGYRTGLYTSPHLLKFNERIRVNGAAIGDDALGRLVEELDPVSDEVERALGHEPTFFEYTTALAFKYFADERADVVVVETGMGGRLDATNVVIPALSVITRISIEHVEHLGRGIEQIAAEKAGIIKGSIPVVCGMTDDSALAVIRRVARENAAPLIDAADCVSVRVASWDLGGQKVKADSESTSYGTMRFPLLGVHQAENLATALTAIEVLKGIGAIEVTEKQVRAGVEEVCWPGRFQVLSSEPPVIVDGAHNPGAGKVLRSALDRVAGKRPVGLVCGMCSDKDMRGFLKQFSGLVKRLWAVPIRSERSTPPSELAAAARELGWEAEESRFDPALREAEAWAGESCGVVCVTGSLFLAGEALELKGMEV